MGKIPGTKNPGRGSRDAPPTFSSSGEVVERIRVFYNSDGRLVFYLRQKECIIGNAIVADRKGKTFILAIGFMKAQSRGNEPEPEPSHCCQCQSMSSCLLARRALTLGPKASLVALLPHPAGPGGSDADLQRPAAAAAC